MKRIMLAAIAVLPLVAAPLNAQETPKSLVMAYDALADTILSVRAAELGFVASLLDGHLHAAKISMKAGDWEGAAAQMALFANEGDNEIGGVRKRLLEGGHHFNAEGEEAGIFEDGYVIVTREAKQALLEASKELRLADTDEARKEVWKKFVKVAQPLLDGAAEKLADG
ncbi:MAG: hypothetical protein ACE5EG_01735 [Thermoanaerobaculia bacterium]